MKEVSYELKKKILTLKDFSPEEITFLDLAADFKEKKRKIFLLTL